MLCARDSTTISDRHLKLGSLGAYKLGVIHPTLHQSFSGFSSLKVLTDPSLVLSTPSQIDVNVLWVVISWVLFSINSAFLPGRTGCYKCGRVFNSGWRVGVRHYNRPNWGMGRGLGLLGSQLPLLKTWDCCGFVPLLPAVIQVWMSWRAGHPILLSGSEPRRENPIFMPFIHANQSQFAQLLAA